jgi:DNA-binding transcriptional LysR family regulator
VCDLYERAQRILAEIDAAEAALTSGHPEVRALAFDGPLQGAALREDGLVFRPDWENVTFYLI